LIKFDIDLFIFALQMKITIACFGKAHESYIKEGVALFCKRIGHYYPIDWLILPSPKDAQNLTELIYKKKEAELLVAKLLKDDYIIALDERGKMLSSPQLGEQINKAALQSAKRLVFIIGGAYGIDDSILSKAQLKWSLSQLVFPHQLVRLILAEQIYRACSINNNEKYHH
jgi:23S rRNA (pseudouridine1915-N3)-methyltransferase